MAGLFRSAASLATLVVALSISNEVSAARIPIPVFFGQGEKIVYLCDLPSDVKKQVCEQLGIDNAAIGYFYKRFHIFWLDAWTWGGERVLFKGDQYWKPPAEAWNAILGKEAAASLSGPFSYRFPLCMLLVGGLCLLGISKSVFMPSIATRARRLLRDHRYQEALRTYFEQLSPPETAPGVEQPPERESPPAVDPEAAFRVARERLVREGIATHQAEDDLRLLLGVMAMEFQARMEAEAQSAPRSESSPPT